MSYRDMLALIWGDFGAEGWKSASSVSDDDDVVLPPLTAKEEALDYYTMPSVSGVEDLCEIFPIVLERDEGGIGEPRFIVRWDEDRLSYFRNSQSTDSEHYEQFEFWTETRLRHTLAHYEHLFIVGEKEGAILTVTMVETLRPLQILAKSPFCWEQRGSYLRIQAHGKKMEALGRFRPGYRGPDFEDLMYQVAVRLAERLLRCDDCEIVQMERKEGPFFLGVRLFGLEESEIPAPRLPAPSRPTATAEKPPATAAATAATPVYRPTVTAAKPPAPKALDTLRSFKHCVRWDQDGYYHAIEVLRKSTEPPRKVHDTLLAALRLCEDCEITAANNSKYLFIVRMLPLRR